MTPPSVSVALNRPVISEQSTEAAVSALQSGWLGYGPRCLELERMVVEGRGGWALATQSCTAALWTAAMLANGDGRPEVILPANTYIACASAFRIAGWGISLCDVDPETGLLDLEDVARHLSPRTRALLVVDTYGQRFPEERARQVCDQHGLLLIRDAAHRLDLLDASAPSADFVCYSFGPTKEAACPDGGMLWSRLAQFAEPARALTYWGISHDTWRRASSRVHEPITVSGQLGLKLRMTDVNAAIVQAQLRLWPAQRQRRHSLMDRYRRALAGRQVRILDRSRDDSCLMATVLVESRSRAELRTRLADMGVATSDHYPSLAGLLGDTPALCPNADRFCGSVITLPMHMGLADEDVDRIASAFDGRCAGAPPV